MFKKENFVFKVGLFALLGILSICAMILFFGDFTVFEDGYEIKAHFRFTNGLLVGAPVRFSGVDIGLVKNVNILSEGTSVEVVLWIKEDVVLRDDVQVFVNTLGVMGEKYIEFIGGTPGTGIIKEGCSPLKGTDPVALNKLAEMGQDIARELNGLVSSLRVIVDDVNIRNNLKETFANTSQMTANISELAHNFNMVINENRVSFYKTMEEFQKNAVMLGSILHKLDAGEGTLGKLINKDTVYNNLEEFTDDVKKHPWKLLIKTKERKKVSKETSEKDSSRRSRRR